MEIKTDFRNSGDGTGGTGLLFLEKIRLAPHARDDFYHDYHEKSIKSIRVSLVLGFILYSVFGLLDYYLAPLTWKQFWVIRFAIVCPLILLVLLLSRFTKFERYMQFALSLVPLAAGLGINVMIALARNPETALYYYAGLILVIMWAYTFARLRFIYAAITSWIIVAAYEITAVYFQDMLATPEKLKIFVSSNFFFIGASMIGMFANYLIEEYARRDFLQRSLIDAKKELLEQERNELRDLTDQFNYELLMARNIQQQLIPAESPRESIAFLYRPMAPVGGDFFDFIDLGNNRIGIFISDVSGHGVPAALIASMERSLLLGSRNIIDNPTKLLIHLNHQFQIISGTNFITAFYGIIDFNNRTFTYSNAGHVPPMIITEHGIHTLKQGKGPPLAVLANNELSDIGKDFGTEIETLQPGTRILLYTDGLTDVRHDNNGRVYFSDILNDILMEYRTLSSKKFIDQLYVRLKAFNDSDSFIDDICVISIDL